MKILILHAINDLDVLRRTTLNQSFCMYKYAPEHEYVLHCYGHQIPDEVRNGSFDAILIDTTFLCYRWIRPHSQFDRLLEEYEFVSRSAAVKIAFPQDDYDHSAVLDRWLASWGVNVVFSPMTRFKDLLYPLTKRIARIEQCHTAYLDPLDQLLGSCKSWDSRSIDVGYRARDLPANFGRAGRLKSQLGRIFCDKLPSEHALKLDISTRSQDEIEGAAWLAFLGNCRFCLGSASGSSLHDPEGSIMDAVLAYSQQNPRASFEEVEAACFPGQDGTFQMTGLGPRNIEAAMVRTCQILVPDTALHPMQPGIHFIGMDENGMNVPEVLRMMHDRQLVTTHVEAACELFSRPEWSYPHFVALIQEQLPCQAPECTRLSTATIARREEELLGKLYRNSISSRRGEILAQSPRHRVGWRGAARELLQINKFLENPRGRARVLPPVLAYRAWHVWRSIGFAGVLQELAGRGKARWHDRAIAQTLASSHREVQPGSITMLVADRRIDRRVLLSARSLQKAGWTVTVIAGPYPTGPDLDQRTFPDIRIVRVDTIRSNRPPLVRALKYAEKEFEAVYFYYNSFLREALRNPASVYVAHDLPVLPAAVVAAREFGSRVAYDAHELYPEQQCFTRDQHALLSETEAMLVREAHLITTVNDSIANEMAKRYSIPLPAVIWNAPEASASNMPRRGNGILHRSLGIGLERRILLLQGGLAPNRNLEDLVRSMAYVKTADVTLVLMGPGDEKRVELKAIARNLRISQELLRFAMPVPQDELLEFTTSADVGIIPYPPVDLNSYFCTPNKLFEYIVAGVPILANDLPELRRFVQQNGFGQVHRMNGPQQIALAIDTIFASDLEGYRQAIAEKRHEFIWDPQGKKLATFYEAAFT